MTTNKKRNVWMLVPLFGTILYFLLYFIATLFYPGGSQLDKNSKGFSWMQNYWCNLLNENAINGLHNPARPIALSAMIILCFTLITFWYIFPRQIQFKKSGKFVIQASGIVSMAIGMFLFTSLHNVVINIATLFGIVALLGTFIGLKKLKWTKLFWMGIFILLLITLNNLLYYGDGLLYFLPAVQKITFLYFLIWICLIDINLYNKINSKKLGMLDKAASIK